MDAVENAECTVLVVEDDAVSRANFAYALRQAGYHVVTAANGVQALRCVRSGPIPDVILLDMLMPQLDGWHFLDELKRHSASLSIPIIVTTSTILTPQWATTHGCAGFLHKPVEEEALLAEVKCCLLASFRQQRERRAVLPGGRGVGGARENRQGQGNQPSART